MTICKALKLAAIIPKKIYTIKIQKKTKIILILLLAVNFSRIFWGGIGVRSIKNLSRVGIIA